MNDLNEYNDFIYQIHNDLEHNIYHTVCRLNYNDKIFIKKLIMRNPTIFLDLLHIKNEFIPFKHFVIPYLINNLTEKITAITDTKYYHLNTIDIIKFIAYSSATSFYKNVQADELPWIDMSLKTSFSLLERKIKSPRIPCIPI